MKVWPRSFNLSERIIGGIKTKKLERIDPVVLKLQVGEVVVFRGDLAHAGCAYQEKNLRMFAYLDLPGVARTKNQTKLSLRGNPKSSRYLKNDSGTNSKISNIDDDDNDYIPGQSY